MIELYQFPPAWQVNASPFCLKVETFCRLAGLDYRVRPTPPFRAPRGKLPFIVDRGETVADSRQIVQHLQRQLAQPVGGALSEAQQARGHLLRQLCEDSLYFALLYARWQDQRYWPQTRAAFFATLPPGVRQLLPVMARRGVLAALRGQGLGRCPEAEVYDRAAADLAALAWSLGQQPFAVGEQPTEYDATVYAFLFNLLRVPQDTPIRQQAMMHSVFADYLARMDRALDGL
ncbi:MAG: glutathione S-transferase family protein [Marinobacter sp.]|uniref:glutathione S-transferase family protein n=1 Tax=Marinobacter sp. TaxID=50741 RepID=UPI00299D7728|nr:glutathione S-transferase family protein [Marinobacter sp.]MDX1756027.1 glutathione S-transferase family protein [Marinobacter sp.]